MKKDLGILRTGLEFIEIDFLNQLENLKAEFSSIAIGIFSDEMFEKLFNRRPIKKYEERVRLASSLKYVDFVFKVNDDSEIVIPPIYEPIIGPKPYHVAYVPGTFDLLHEGHLQHLLMCRNMCDILVVGINSDELVFANKGKHAQMSANDRMEIIRNLKFVDHVYLVTTNSKETANNWVKSTIGKPIDVIFMGSDLKGNHLEDNPTGIPIVFTDRDAEFQKTNSSTYWVKKYLETKQDE